MGLKGELFALFGHGFSGRDLILLAGGMFLIFKATREIHEKLEGEDGHVTAKLAPKTPAQAPESLQSCVGDALRKMKFPASGDTFRKLLRNWKFASA